ncbi:MAG: polyprenyl diphosphate synthase [Gammaproteobacteria bacterium WSBS_2016_MAG_OTU1]
MGASATIDSPDTLRHVAIIMDGNGRWAQQRNLPRKEGHRRGLTAARLALHACVKWRIPHLTLFAFSSENWNRPQEEVSALLFLFAEAAKSLGTELAENGVQVRFIGQRERFSSLLQTAMSAMEKMTEKGKRLQVNVAVSYSGRWDITQAAARIAETNGDFSAENFAQHLSTGALPEVDLLIRTGGEKRISNFMLWQAAYSELYFTPVLWPDFSEEDFNAAIDDYMQRERRFGAIKEAC